MSVKVKWNDKEFEREILNPEAAKLLNRMGAWGEGKAKRLTADAGPLHAVDKGILLNSWTFDPATPRRLVVRIGTNVKYAVYVLLGFIHFGGKHIKAKPILRTMLAQLKVEFRSAFR